jgi:monovalent cation:H+ antiporter-2, CPA2 family
MNELPNLINDLALILISAAVITLIFKKLKQPLVLGYVVAGFLVSPKMPYTLSIFDKADIQTWADIGVIFLLFSLGLEFSFKKIVKMGAAPVIAAVTIMFCMMILGMIVGHSFGWHRMDCIFLGGMIAMSSTTIIYKAFDDMGLRQQRFTSLVMSVLILEDILAIVLMVMLSTMARSGEMEGGQMVTSIMRIGFFLILWFVVGIFLIPYILRRLRKLINQETLLIFSLGLCFLMAIIASEVGFSSAFGAFVMGSILAETVEAEKIVKIVAPVKDLFGAVFFVSVGMLVDITVLIDYAVPIIILVLTILLGQAIFGTTGFMLSGQPLKTAMKCGFSMAQIGEFAFIIASLGLSLGVIGHFLYPVVVAVSVITTFLTPYMIKASTPCYNKMERLLPPSWINLLNNITVSQPSVTPQNNWKKLIHALIRQTVVYSILSVAVIALMLTFFLPFIRSILPHWWANAVCGTITVTLISPFLRAIVMKKNHSEEFKELWTESGFNRLPLIFTIVVRAIIAVSFVFYICNYLSRFTDALMISIALVLVVLMILSRKLKKGSISMERMFMNNLRSREIEALVMGKKKPLYANHLLDRDIHIADIDIPENSKCGGKSLKELSLGQRYGVHVSSILRGKRRLNIPNGDDYVFPGDKIQVIGSDEQLTHLSNMINNEVYEEDFNIENREMKLRQIVISSKCRFLGKTLKESGIRDKYNCMVVGMEKGEDELTQIDPSRPFKQGDILWVVGEKSSLEALVQV